MRTQERFLLFQVIAHCRTSDSRANESLNRGVILLGEFVFDHITDLHHEPDSLISWQIRVQDSGRELLTRAFFLIGIMIGRGHNRGD